MSPTHLKRREPVHHHQSSVVQRLSSHIIRHNGLLFVTYLTGMLLINFYIHNSTTALILNIINSLLWGVVSLLWLKPTIHQYIGRHLAVLASFSQRLNVHNPTPDLLIRLPDYPENYNDEFTTIVQQTNSLIQQVRKNTEVLNSKINDQTRDIRLLLDHIQQGIFTVLPNNTIGEEYSKYLETILECHQIAGRDVMDALFKESNITPEQTNNLVSALVSCLGEESHHFEANAHFLPNEIARTTKDGLTKILQISWTPIVNKKNYTEKILVSLKDISRIKKLERSAQKKQEELEIMSEVLTVPAEQLHSFLLTSKKLLHENEKMILHDFTPSPPTINLLSQRLKEIKYHTRTHHFQTLQLAIHNHEQPLILMANNQIAWNAQVALGIHFKIFNLLDQYKKIHDFINGRRVMSEHVSIQEHHHADHLSLLDKLEELTWGTLTSQQKMFLNQLRHYLNSLESTPLTTIITQETTLLIHLANDLGKEPPHITIAPNHILVKNKHLQSIQTIIIHLLRNSVDHGIEASDERLHKGKEPLGQIEFSFEQGRYQLMLRYRDDGRGVNIPKIKQSAIHQKIVSPDSKLTPEEVANLIFFPNISTSSTPLEVDPLARGNGLSLVKRLIEEMNGDIKVHLIDAPQKDWGHYPFEIVIRLPNELLWNSEQPDENDKNPRLVNL